MRVSTHVQKTSNNMQPNAIFETVTDKEYSPGSQTSVVWRVGLLLESSILIISKFSRCPVIFLLVGKFWRHSLIMTSLWFVNRNAQATIE